MGIGSFVPGKKKYLFCADLKGKVILQPIMEQVIDKNADFEFFFLENKQNSVPTFTNLSKWLSGQRMGSYLYIAAPWSQFKFIKQLADEIGFSEEEAQFIGYGEKEKKVFCCRCHGITRLEVEQKELLEVNCIHCDLLLEISNHYSRLRDAYLGYVDVAKL